MGLEIKDHSDQTVKLADIARKREFAANHPYMHGFINLTKLLCNCIFWVAFWSLIVQCTCRGCVW